MTEREGWDPYLEVVSGRGVENGVLKQQHEFLGTDVLLVRLEVASDGLSSLLETLLTTTPKVVVRMGYRRPAPSETTRVA